MAALAADTYRARRGDVRERSYKMAASTTIYKGSLVCLNSSGLAIPAAEATGNGNVVGVAKHGQVSAATGDYDIVVQRGVFKIACDASLTQLDVGDNCYATTDNDADDAAGSTYKLAIGEITGIETGFVWVDVGSPRPWREWQSAEQTGTGASQNVAHTLGKVPAFVDIRLSEIDGNANDVALGAHTTANVVVTVTSGVKFFASARY